MKKIIFVLSIIHCCFIIANAQWVRVGIWEINNSVFSLAVSQDSVSGATLFAGTDWHGHKSTNNGTTWIEIGGGLPGHNVFVFFVHGSYIFSGSSGFSYTGVHRSSNNGVNWTAVNNGFPGSSDIALAFASSASNLFVGAFHSGIYLSTNNGESWTAVNNGFPVNHQVSSMKSSGSNLYAGTFGGGVLFTNNNGASWTPINNGLPTLNIYSMDVLGQNLYVVNGGIFLTTNNGASWETAVNGLPINPSIESIYSYGNNLFAGGYNKIFHSTDGGANWNSISSGLTGYIGRFQNFAVAPDGTGNMYLFAGTDDNGLWRRPLSDIISVQNLSTEVPDNFQLKQNYPNPFNPITNIEFSIPKLSNVKVIVYDSQGKEVAALLNERLSAGSYRVDFDGTNLSSGIYFYRMETEEFIQTKTMVLIK